MRAPASKTIFAANGSITLRGTLSGSDAFDFAKCLDILVTKQGYSDVTLDFSQAAPVWESFMVPAIALIRDRRRQRVTFSLVLPEAPASRSIFHNANWSHLINESDFEKSTYEGEGHMPASTYETATDRNAAVDRIMSMILKVVSLDRKQLVALEWSVNEVSDNVLNHAEAPLGGVIQASTINLGGRPFVEFAVADAGMGIKRSLNETQDVRALERAIQEGVTRNPATNQGNGLYGSFRVSTLSNGRFELISYHASLVAEGTSLIRPLRRSDAFYPGTAVICRIGCNDEKLIESALMFKGKVHTPGFDYLEKKFETAGDNAFVFVMKNECQSFGSREAGIGTRMIIENLLRAEPDYMLTIDFADVLIVSSSFADEVFGRLFVALGPMAFMSRISFRNVESAVRAVLDRSILLRCSQEVNISLES